MRKGHAARKPDGVFLSNGPGDPTAAPYAAKTVRDLLGKTPIFGVCMGHQILSLAIGAGSQMLQPLAIAVIGGILISMLLSLIITPAIQYFLTRPA